MPASLPPATHTAPGTTPTSAIGHPRHRRIPVATAVARLGGALAIVIGACFGVSPSAAAQAPPDSTARQALGDWRVYPTLARTLDVAAGRDFLAFATPNAVVLRYGDDGESRVLDKVNTLTQANPQHLAVNPERPDELLIVYRDGAVEVVVAERSRHFSRAIAAAQVAGLRDINGVRYLSADVAAIATDFGFLLFDVTRGLFLDDVRTGVPVDDVAELAGDLYLATAGGLRVLPDYRAQPTLRDTSRYIDLNAGALGGLRGPCYSVAAFDGRLWAGFDEELYSLQRSGSGTYAGAVGWVVPGGRFSDLSVSAAGLAVVAEVPNAGNGPDRVLYASPGEGFVVIAPTCLDGVSAVAIDPSGRLAVAGARGLDDGAAGLVVLDGPTSDCREIATGGPGFRQVFDVVARAGVVAVAAGGLTPQEGYTYNREGIAVLRDGTWSNINRSNRPVLVVQDSFASSPADFIAVALGGGGEAYGGAFYEGLYQFARADTTGDIVYDESNSSLRTHVDDPLRVRIGGLTFDEDGNLWVSNFGARRGISVRTPAGDWASFDLNACAGTRNFRDLVVARRFDGSRVVYAIETTRGVVALDPGRDLLDPSDDRCARISTNSGLADPDVRSIALDRQGDVWLGTNSGIAILSGDPFAEGFQAFIPVGTAIIDGIRGNLFEGTPIQAIAVDGGNRKWLGTPNGLFLIGARDNEELASFDARNSPLPDGDVRTLAYDGTTGLLWVGGDNGLASLQTDATAGSPFAHADTVEIFPQPVRPDYAGPIAIRGLGQDADVKITDVQGRLVFETTAVGGTATWDGRDYTGRRPASGVYFVWATVTPSLGKPATIVGKIALLR